MSAPISQQQLIKKYFNSLVKEFITDSRHNKHISIVFEDHIESSKPDFTTMGQTWQRGGGEYTTWKVWTNGEEVPGSRKTTYFPYHYVITFLNHYKDENELRGTVVHEFAHLYLYATIGGKHDHDNRFYSTMEFMENWLNKNQGLSPRADKSRDYDQYEDNHSKINNDKKNICPECFVSSPHHSPQCPQNQPHPTNPKNKYPNITNESQTVAELDHLINLLNSSRDLSTLEAIYQNKIKTSPLCQGENSKDNKKALENAYQLQKYFLQNSGNYRRFSINGSNSPNEGRVEKFFLVALVAMIIVFTVIIGYLLISEPNSSKSKEKR